jgi:hypothetical protein
MTDGKKNQQNECNSLIIVLENVRAFVKRY